MPRSILNALLLLMVVFASLVWCGGEAFAQAAPAAGGGASQTYPNFTIPFFRGNSPGDRGGGYLNLWTFGIILGWFFLWVYSTQWVSDDSSSLKIRNDLWNSLMIGGGVLGFVFLFITNSFGAGFLGLLLCQGVPFGTYVFKRNDRVPESARVLTPRHIRNVALRLLARVGIDIAPKGIRDSAIGPPIRFIGKTRKGGDAELANRQVENSKGYLAARELIYDAILRRATDVHLEPTEEELAIRYRIDGVLRSSEPFDRATGDALINVFKVLSAIDITERRKAQDGSFRADMEGRDIDFRVATQGTNAGEKLSIRILDQSNSVSSLAELGMRKQLQGQLAEIIKQPHGMFLSCGPTGAGKSTTLYAALNEIDRHISNVITVEDPIEYKMENVTQIEINTKAGQSFATSLRSILRQDPDVVMVGEIRDDETARIACQAANTGHMVF
ncbi:MAG: Flp pilus assembly complex ATPase component TadA, partial [Planctomycetaceae bacterium]|nr:Flp pilus assembly complex ATPase component TadA [Planctomycetaceae bacterium]